MEPLFRGALQIFPRGWTIVEDFHIMLQPTFGVNSNLKFQQSSPGDCCAFQAPAGRAEYRRERRCDPNPVSSVHSRRCPALIPI